MTALANPQLGVPLVVGVLPATLLGIPPRRRARIVILIIGVLIGASLFLGGVLAHLELLGTAVVLVIGCAAATARSRWYIRSAFTTFLVVMMLLNGHLDETTARVNERVGKRSSVSGAPTCSAGSCP